MAHVRFGYQWTWDGNANRDSFAATDEIGQVQALREQIAQWWNVPAERNYRVPGLDNSVMPWKIAQGRERDQWARLGWSRFLLLLGSPAFAQSPTYGVGRTPTAEEIRRMDISIGPTGEELLPGRGTAKEGAQNL